MDRGRRQEAQVGATRKGEVVMARRPKGSGGLRHLSGDRWQLTIYVAGKRLTCTDPKM